MKNNMVLRQRIKRYTYYEEPRRLPVANTRMYGEGKTAWEDAFGSMMVIGYMWAAFIILAIAAIVAYLIFR